MGAKWTENRDPIVTDWPAYLARIVSEGCYTDGTETKKG